MPKYKFDDIAFNSTEKKKPTEEDKYTYIGLEHLDSGTLTVSRWGAEVTPIGEKLVMRKGDVLFGKRRAYQKKVGIAPFDGISSAHGMVLRPKEAVITKEYFPLFISSDYFLNEAIRISVGSLSPTVNWKDLKDLEFSIPTIEEQRRLTPLIWAAIDAKNTYKNLFARTDDLVKSQFIEMFGDPIENPKNWKRMPLRESCKILTGNTPSRKVPDYYGSFMEWIKSDNISANSMLLSTAAEKLSASGAAIGRVVEPGTILMTCIAGSLNTIGNVAVVDRTVAFNQQINALIPEKYDSLVLYHLLQLLRPQLHEAANSALKCILNKGTLGDIVAIVPDEDAQKRFSAVAQQSDKSKFAVGFRSNRNLSRCLVIQKRTQWDGKKFG